MIQAAALREAGPETLGGLSSMTTAQQERMLTARLHPIKRKRDGEVYSVMFRGP
jgi:hypothetical protein